MSLFHCLCRTKVSVQVRGSKCSCFVIKPVFTVRSCQKLAQPPSRRTPLVGCSRLLIQYIRGYHPYWRPFLHPQPEDAPCHGERDSLITVPSFTRPTKIDEDSCLPRFHYNWAAAHEIKLSFDVSNFHYPSTYVHTFYCLTKPHFCN
jgi:hypothetical protein